MLQQILQTSGHTLLVDWETIFEVLSNVYWPALSDPASQSAPSPPGHGHPPPLGYLQERRYLVLIKIDFQCLTLICAAPAALSPEHLRPCISMIGQFGQQADTNIALVAAESLLGRFRRDTDEVVCMGAIRTLFRTLQLYGATLSLNTWDECIWKVMFPLLDTLSPHRRWNALTAPSSPDTATHANDGDTLVPDSSSSSSWDELKVVAIQSIGAIMDLPSAPALRCFERTLKAAATFLVPSVVEALRSSLVEIWKKT
ncbi:hypothetical protein F5888DRAFT_1824999 [Russula emetica]|nr:hypothetical protein F5888DRAFT_1824999 [Russula emetica]